MTERERLTEMTADALALINRQQAEIERLQKHNTEYARKHYQDGRTEAIKEFAERLKDNTREFGSASGIKREVDTLVKEMTEDHK